ncbi:MAG: DUF1669 domain-containing protein [Candidatus Magasanikbacteria bacterium]|nr:DUF1669 domain-containing protein [Candidatus Magasanikbacteria bacterium]
MAPQSDPSLNSPETTSRFFIWLIPVLLLFFAAALVVAFLYMRSDDQEIAEQILLQDQQVSTTGTISHILDFIPAETIEVSEPFSGQLYFNTDFGQTHLSSLIINAIDKAEVQIEVAVYSMDHPLIRDALYRAANRGVSVKLLLSEKRKETHDLVFYNPPQNISRVDAGFESSRGSMHHKFIIIDRNFAAAKLFFGSYNFTSLQEKFDPSFVLETTRPEIIDVFGREFNRLYTGGALTDRNPYAALLHYPEGYIEIWFTPAPSNSVGLRTRFLGLIADAKKIIEVLIWNLTDTTVAQTILQKSTEGVPITILTDDSNYSLPDSVFPFLNSQKELYRLENLQVFTDHKRNLEIQEVYGEEDFNSFLHHHLLLVDDDIAVFGTNNWSTNGFFNNNESIMISNIPYMFQSFKQAFDANLDKAR